MVYQDLALVEPQDISTNLNMGQEQLRGGLLGLAGLRRPQGDAPQLRGRARPARRPHRPDDAAGRDAVRRSAPGRGPGPQRDPRQRRVAGHPAARRADRRARLRADQERRGADPADGRPGHRDRASSPTTSRSATRSPTGSSSSTAAARSPTCPPPAPTATTSSAGSPARGRRCSPSRRRAEHMADPPRVRRPASTCSTASPRSRRRWPTPSSTGGCASTWSRPLGPAPDAATRDLTVDGPHGPVPVRVYEPAGDGAGRPALLWLHGGAFMFGDLDMPEADLTAREICARAGAVVVSVDYRLAVGGVHHPVPLDDCVAAARWLRDSAADLGVDPDRIHLGGASAGGNLATATVLRLRDEDGWQPASLVADLPGAAPRAARTVARGGRRPRPGAAGAALHPRGHGRHQRQLPRWSALAGRRLLLPRSRRR